VISSTLIVSLYSSRRLEQQIANTTTTLHHLVDSMLRASVRTYLLSKVEAGRDLAEEALLSMKREPERSEEIRRQLEETLLTLQVADQGYYYAVDTTGRVVFHPDRQIVGTNQADQEPVETQLRELNGYHEYRWQNTDEQEPRKKALYMSYIPELDWILTATSYRDEFTKMIDMESLRESVRAVEIGESGYAYVVGRDGSIIAHPYLSGNEGSNFIPEAEYRQLIDQFFTHNDGYTTYRWPDEGGEQMRKKMVNLKLLEDFDWIIGTAFYTDQVYRPMIWIVLLNVAVAFVVASLLFMVIYRMNASIERNISSLGSVFRTAINGNLEVRAQPGGPSELVELGENLNQFLTKLQEKTERLSASLEEKEALLREIQHRVKNNLQTILSLLNLQRQSSESEEAARALAKTDNRITAMSMVYDYLSHRGDVDGSSLIAMKGFIEEYIDSILISLEVDVTRIGLTKEIEEVSLPRNTAISCGLILNEMMIESLEESMDVGPVLRVELVRETEHFLRMSVADNRRSPAKESPEGGERLERSLVAVLTKQIGGQEKVVSDGSFEHQIRFQI
jgi:two-component sensor histidine kinase